MTDDEYLDLVRRVERLEAIQRAGEQLASAERVYPWIKHNLGGVVALMVKHPAMGLDEAALKVKPM